jgi:hypothetical protein
VTIGLPERADRWRAVRRGALSGALAALVWSASEPPIARALGTSFSDTRLLGRWAAGESAWLPAGIAIHAANGAAFGAAFALLGGRGARAGVSAAMLEYVATWPGMAVADRLHPDRRSGRWPDRLLTDRRVAAQEALTHALFGAVLGTLAERLDRGRGASPPG